MKNKSNDNLKVVDFGDRSTPNLEDDVELVATEECSDRDQSNAAAHSLFEGIGIGLRKEMSLFAFLGFFEPLSAVSMKGEVLTIAAPTEFHRDWVQDHYLEKLEEMGLAVAGHQVTIRVVHDARFEKAPKPDRTFEEHFGQEPRPQSQTPAKVHTFRAPQTTDIHRAQPIKGSAPKNTNSLPQTQSIGRPANTNHKRLNPKYTFDSYVIGPSNQMAFAAARAVAEHPADKYSPLFLFGGVGLGKTHLLQAIGIEAQKRHPGIRVVYMSAEQWVNEYISDIRNRRFDDFRKRYRRGCDILLLDDIQFLAGKDASQDEFFHTFNSLHESHRQIVVTSDRYPHEIKGLEERLKTRLEWGLVADVQPPEIETRIAILQRKAEELKIPLDPKVAEVLATKIRGSVRALEGALRRVSAFSQLTGSPIDVRSVQDQVRAITGNVRSELNIDTITSAVASYFDLQERALKSKSRQRQITRARQVAMFLIRRHLNWSFPEIGRAFGRDHSTVMTSVRKVTGLLKDDATTQAVIKRLENVLLD